MVASLWEVPISGSTNAIDAEFNIKDNREYLQLSNGITYVSADNLPILNGQEEIQVSAEAVWYRTESCMQLQFDIPEDGAVAVYDSALVNKDFTTVSGTDSVMTQEGGYIVFIGSGIFFVR